MKVWFEVVQGMWLGMVEVEGDEEAVAWILSVPGKWGPAWRISEYGDRELNLPSGAFDSSNKAAEAFKAWVENDGYK